MIIIFAVIAALVIFIFAMLLFIMAIDEYYNREDEK